MDCLGEEMIAYGMGCTWWDDKKNIAQLKSYGAEWWHYNLNDAGSYPLQDFQMK